MKTTNCVLAALVVSLAAHAQTPAKAPRVGILNNATVAVGGHLTAAFVRGMADLGYVDGKTIQFDVRYADGQLDRVPALAQELGALKPDVVFAASALAANAVRKSGTNAPIVFALAPDPVGEGFAASLARPGGNMTGLTTQSPEVAAKRVELIREAFTKTSRVAVLYALAFPGVPAELAESSAWSGRLAGSCCRWEAKRPEAIESAFAEMVKWRADVLLVVENPMFFFNRKSISELSERNRLPAIYRSSDYVTAGGLMSYGANYADLCRRAAGYVDKILRGAKAGDLPIEQPVKFELVINLKTAKAMGLTIPRDLLVRADQLLD